MTPAAQAGELVHHVCGAVPLTASDRNVSKHVEAFTPALDLRRGARFREELEDDWAAGRDLSGRDTCIEVALQLERSMPHRPCAGVGKLDHRPCSEGSESRSISSLDML